MAIGGVFLYNNVTTAKIFVKAVGMFGKMACSLFVLMSGFFLIKNQKKQNNFPLITKFLFYSISIWALLTITHLIPFKVSSLIDAFIPFIAKNGNWFVTFYILLLFIVPYLNKFLTSLDKKTFQKFNLTILLIWSIIPTLTNYKWSL